MPKLRALAVSTCLIVLASLLIATPAQAKSSRKLSYSYERIWPTAVRFLRVDEGLKILEKDADTGYVLFELKDEGKTFQGSLEVVRRQDAHKRDAVELIVQLSDRPSYMEASILERMLVKVRAELGTPREPAPEAPAPPSDEGSDSATDPSQSS